jgi:aminoglycoside phosphotransferase (APT) family kinase protein
MPNYCNRIGQLRTSKVLGMQSAPGQRQTVPHRRIVFMFFAKTVIDVLGYSQPMTITGNLLASGRDADVFAIAESRVLRRYRDGTDATAEAAVMRYLADQGFPVPAVHEAHGADLVMERLPGPTMLHALATGAIGLPEAAAVLVDLHDRLHALPPRLATDPAARVLHLDLHPDNVMFSDRGPVVIDWRNTEEGPPDLDLAMSAVILAQVAVDDTSPELAVAGGVLLAEFLRRVSGDPLSSLDDALDRRGADPALSTREVGLLAAARARIHTNWSVL